ncbi:hypothetical protein [Sporosarcina sp. OR05]|uniref:hypothetical protein n=1 Tax=Sporosarcina sp. OR05 TaxID=2969819 RepID=UPI00352ACB78
MKDLVNEDPVQLKQTIIYLRAELNKYQTKDAKATSAFIHTLQTENNRLKEEHRQLLHSSKKLSKRMSLYEKRIASLQTQNKKLLGQLSAMEKAFQEGMLAAVERNYGLAEVVNALQQVAEKVENDDLSEVVQQLQVVIEKMGVEKNVSIQLMEALQVTIDRIAASSGDRVEVATEKVLEQLQGIVGKMETLEKGKDVCTNVRDEMQIIGERVLAVSGDRVEVATGKVLEQLQGIVGKMETLEKGDMDRLSKTSTALLQKLESIVERMEIYQQNGGEKLEMVTAQLLEKQQVVIEQLEGYRVDGKLSRELSSQAHEKLKQIIDTLTILQGEGKQKEALLALLADKKQQVQALNVELDEQKTLQQTQRELIQVLETYVERLALEPEELHTDSILQQIIALTEAYANKHQD